MKKEKIRLAAKALQLLNSHKIDTVYFHGNSMRPFLVEGDEFIVAHVKLRHIKPGDIVTYRNGDKFPTYRVIAKKGDNLTLKPDNWVKIEIVDKKNILGKVVERKRDNISLENSSPEWILYSRNIMLKYKMLSRIKRFILFKVDGIKRRLKRLKGYLKNTD